MATAARSWMAVNPARLSRVVFTCEHASHRLPIASPRAAALRSLLRTHRGWDPGAWRLTRALARRFRAPAIGGRWSRLWLDVNRDVGDATLVLERIDGHRLPWNRGLTREALERRVSTVHLDYHDRVERLLMRHRIRRRRPLLVAVHTFAPLVDGEIRRYDAGVLFRVHREPAARAMAAIVDAGLTVRANQPYSGFAGMMYSAERHGTHHGLTCLEFEFNQARFDDPSSFEQTLRAATAAVRAVLAAERDR